MPRRLAAKKDRPSEVEVAVSEVAVIAENAATGRAAIVDIAADDLTNATAAPNAVRTAAPIRRAAPNAAVGAMSDRASASANAVRPRLRMISIFSMPLDSSSMTWRKTITTSTAARSRRKREAIGPVVNLAANETNRAANAGAGDGDGAAEKAAGKRSAVNDARASPGPESRL